MTSSSCLNQILGLVSDGAVIEDDGGRITFANPAAGRLLGREPADLAGRRWAELAPPLPAAAQEEARGCEVELRRADGTAVPVTVSAHRLIDGVRPCGTLWLLSPPPRPAGTSEPGRLSPADAHELNNALTVILLQVRLLYNVAPMLPRFQEGLAAIKEQVQRIARMTGDVLATARAEPAAPARLFPPGPAVPPPAAGEPEPDFDLEPAAPAGLFPTPRKPRAEPVLTDINAAIEATLDLQRYGLQSDGIDVVLDLDPALPAARVNPDQLQQVLINLINNAQQAIGTVGRPGQIAIGTAVVRGLNGYGPRLQIRVSDNGPGIPLDALPRLFRPFFSTKPPGEGTGLGLAICNRLVREHGGRIWATNNAQAGATFIIELPLPPP